MILLRDQSGPGSNGNKGVPRIPQSYSITGSLPSDCLVSYPGYSLWTGVLPLCRDAIGEFFRLNRLGKFSVGFYRLFSDSKARRLKRITLPSKVPFMMYSLQMWTEAFIHYRDNGIYFKFSIVISMFLYTIDVYVLRDYRRNPRRKS